MAFKNYKTIFTGSGDAITGGYSAFFGDLKKMKRIQKIKKSHAALFKLYNFFAVWFSQHSIVDNIKLI